jgi:hypothetical protein
MTSLPRYFRYREIFLHPDDRAEGFGVIAERVFARS